MSNDTSPDSAMRPLPPDVDQRLNYWRGLWTRSIAYHYFFGVVSVAASVISTSVDGTPAKVFSIIAAIGTAMIGFMHPERRYLKFVGAWRLLDVAAMRYRHGLLDKQELIAAVEQGHAVIANFEEQVKPDALAAELRSLGKNDQAAGQSTEGSANEPAQTLTAAEPVAPDAAAPTGPAGDPSEAPAAGTPAPPRT